MTAIDLFSPSFRTSKIEIKKCIMSNSLLLRLFTSEYFNAWIAISYLFKYPENVGIQHYLCSQLKKFPVNEIEFFLPQLM